MECSRYSSSVDIHLTGVHSSWDDSILLCASYMCVRGYVSYLPIALDSWVLSNDQKSVQFMYASLSRANPVGIVPRNEKSVEAS
jgi:hypothetical protein